MCKYRQIEIVFIEMLSVIVSCFEKFSLLLVAADDLVEQCPAAVPESICQFVVHPKTMHIEKGVLTSGRGKGKNYSESHADLSFYKYNIKAYNSSFFSVLTAHI